MQSKRSVSLKSLLKDLMKQGKRTYVVDPGASLLQAPSM